MDVGWGWDGVNRGFVHYLANVHEYTVDPPDAPKAFLIEKDRYALALLRYIHENPVKAGIVVRPQEYAWSSDRRYRRGKGLKRLDVDRLLGMLGRGGRSAAIAGYRQLMLEELEEPYEKAESWGQAIKGDEGFADRAFQEAGEPRLLRGSLTVEAVAREVARKQGINLAEMSTRGQGRAGSRARVLTAWVGREVGGISIARTAKHFRRDTSTMAGNVSSSRCAPRKPSNAPARISLKPQPILKYHRTRLTSNRQSRARGGSE